MDDIQMLLAIQGVRHTKAEYWYAVDNKDWTLLASLFGPDSTCDFRSARLKAGEGLDTLPPLQEAIAAKDPSVAGSGPDIVQFLIHAATPLRTVHHGHEPLIDILGPDAARAIWPMFDYIDNGTDAMKGYGFYHDSYRRVDDRWIIESMVLTRLRMDGNNPRRSAW